MLLALQCGDHESSLIQNGGLSALVVVLLVVFSFSLCLPIGLVESAALPVSSLDQLRYLLIQWNDNA